MKEILRENLKEGEIYFVKYQNTHEYITELKKNFTGLNILTVKSFHSTAHYSKGGQHISEQFLFYEAAPEQKHWLKECIKANKLVSQDIAMKTFIKKPNTAQITRFKTKVAIEAIDAEGSIFKLGDTVRKPKTKTALTINGFYTNDKNDVIVITDRFKININSLEHCIVEPEFILPELWYIKTDIKEYPILQKWFNIFYPNIELNKFGIVGHYKTNGGYKSQIGHIGQGSYHANCGYSFGIEITFEQFKQYVLFDGLKIGDKIWGGEKTIIDLQYINGQSVVFYKYTHNNYTSSGCRMLLKNVQK